MDMPVREVPMTPVSASSNRSTQSYTSGELWKGCSNISQGQRGESVGSAEDKPVREVPMTPVSARSNRSTQSYTSGELWEGWWNGRGVVTYHWEQRGEPEGSAADTLVREVPVTPVSARSNRSTQSYTPG